MLLTDVDNGRTLMVPSGDMIDIQFKENPTTGYRWEIDQICGNIIEQQSTFQTSPVDVIGSGGRHIFHFVTGQAGTASICLKQRRTWEGNTFVANHYAVTLQIRN